MQPSTERSRQTRSPPEQTANAQEDRSPSSPVLYSAIASAIGERRSFVSNGSRSREDDMTDDNHHRQRHSARGYRQARRRGSAPRSGISSCRAICRSRRSRRSTRCCSSTRSSSSATRDHLDDAEQERFALRLGKLVPHPTVGATKGTASILELDSGRGGGRADQWHTDVTFVDAYPKISVLRGVVIPPVRRRHDLVEHGRVLSRSAGSAAQARG